MKRATLIAGSIGKIHIGFNPRPREEGDLLRQLDSLTLSVSIHALVKRATVETTEDKEKTEVSIHALVKRATFLRSGSCAYCRRFNPRPREEGD